MDYFGIKLLGGLLETPHVRALDSNGLQLMDSTGNLGLTILSGGEIDAHNNKIIHIATPTVGTDVTNKAYVDAYLQGLEWQDSVKDRYNSAGGTPGGPTHKDRYIANGGGSGWTDKYIYEWNNYSSSWIETIPNEGFACWVDDEDRGYTYNGAGNWVVFGAIVHHDSLKDIDSTGTVYHHLTQFEYNDLTQSGAVRPREAIPDMVGDMVSGNTESGISVTYDDGTGKLNFNVDDPTISISGDATGSAVMTNLGNVDIATTVDHDLITNTHNLTTDIDHDQLTNTHNLTSDIDHGLINDLEDNDHHPQYKLKKSDVEYHQSSFSIDSTEIYEYKTYVIDGTGNVTVTMPTILEGHIGYDIAFVMEDATATIKVLTISVSGTDIVGDSSPGGTIYTAPIIAGIQMAIMLRVTKAGEIAVIPEASSLWAVT